MKIISKASNCNEKHICNHDATHEYQSVQEAVNSGWSISQADEYYQQNLISQAKLHTCVKHEYIYEDSDLFQGKINLKNFQTYSDCDMKQAKPSENSTQEHKNEGQYLPQTNEAQLFQHQLSLSELANNLLPNVGTVQSKWLNSNGWAQTICYGTGFAISKRIVLTCAHNVYSQRKSKACSTIVFAPNHQLGFIKKNSTYQSANRDFLCFQQLKSGQTYTTKTISQDIALIFMSQDLPFSQFPKVGLQTLDILTSRPEISLTGYPSRDYFDQIDILKIKPTRSTLKGTVLDVDNDIVYHSAATDFGQSGSPLIIKNSDGLAAIIGIHTHRSLKKSSAVNLNAKVLKRLILGEINFALMHRDAEISIKFPISIQREVLSSLEEEIKEKVFNKIAKDQLLQKIINEPQVNDNGKFLILQKQNMINIIQRQQQPSQKIKEKIEQFFDIDEIQQDFQEPPFEKLLKDQIKQLQHNLKSQYSQQFQRQIYKFSLFFNKFLRFVKKLDGLLIREMSSEIGSHFNTMYKNLDQQILTLKEKLENIGLKASVSKFKSANEHIDSLNNYYSKNQSQQITFFEIRDELDSNTRNIEEDEMQNFDKDAFFQVVCGWLEKYFEIQSCFGDVISKQSSDD